MSLQVYNLPETVRESDVEKLSFAVQLAEGFYAASQVHEPQPVNLPMACHLQRSGGDVTCYVLQHQPCKYFPQCLFRLALGRNRL